MVASILAAHRRAASSTTAPARTWPAASRRRCCDAARRRLGAVRGRRVLARRRSPAQLAPRAILLGNLFRDQLDRYGELETIAERWAASSRPAGRHALVLNADDPMVADLGRDRAAAVYFGVDDPRDRAGRDPARLRRQALPALRRALRLRRRTTSAISASTTARLRAARGARRPAVVRDRHRARRRCAARASTLRGRRRERRRARSPLPGLYNVYNALGAAALATALGVALDDVVAGLAGRRAGVRARASASRVGGRELSILLVKNPAGANEVLRTLRARGRPARRARGAQRPDRRRPRRLAGSGTPTSSCSPPRIGRVTCAGTRAAEMALRFKYAGVDGVADRGRTVAADGASTPRSTGATRPLYALPTYTAMLELRELLVAPRQRRTGSFAVSEGDLARPRVRRATAPTCRCGARWPTTPRRPGARRRRGHRAGWRSTSRAPATRSTALERRPRAARGAAPRRAAAAGLHDVRTVVRRRARLRDRRRAVRADHRADADDPAARRRARPGRVPARARARTCAPAGCVALAIADALEAIEPSTTTRREADTLRARRRALRQRAGRRARRRACGRHRARARDPSTPARRAHELIADTVRLDHLDGRAARAARARRSACRAEPALDASRTTDEYVGSTVVMLRG